MTHHFFHTSSDFKVRLLSGIAGLGLILPASPLMAEVPAEKAAAGIVWAEALSDSFEHVAETVTPSVVTIASESRPEKQVKGKRPPIPFPFEDFFGEEFMDRGPQSPRRGLGTGVVIDDEGHVLTNNHVVEDAKIVTVTLSDERKVKADVVATDPRTDLAVIKLKSKEKPPAALILGDSDKLKVGEWVVAVGASFGFRNTITAGIVSAKGRSLNGGGQYEDFIQTDAAINPGNSGGPLVNLKGEVVGINTAIISKSGGYMGIGFAIPINMAKAVMESLLKNGKVTRGWLGVGIQNLDDDMASSFNFAGTDGALVGQIDPSGPAKKAGIKQGDIIVEINGKAVKNVNELRNYVAGLAPNKEVDVVLIREARKMTVPVKIGELAGQSVAQEEPEPSENTAGLTVENLTPEMRRRVATKRTQGVVVVGVEPDSAAQESGLQPGDIIVSINGLDVGNSSDFANLVKKGDLERGIRMVIETQGMERFILLKSDR